MPSTSSLLSLLVLLAPVSARSLQPTQPALQRCRAGTPPSPMPLSPLHKLRGGESTFTMSAKTAWMVLFSATVFELASTGFMHKAQGFSKPLPSALAVLFYGASFYIFNLSLRGIEISVAYAVWSAVVMAALAAIGMTVLGESVTTAKVGGIAAIIGGTILLSKDLTE